MKQAQKKVMRILQLQARMKEENQDYIEVRLNGLKINPWKPKTIIVKESQAL